ncbi:MAG: IS110 family transposase [Candidatus Limnocylindrales bacterium]|jgi:transposase
MTMLAATHDRSLLDRLPRLERECGTLTHRIEALVEGHPPLGLPGAGPITVARLIAEAGDMRRFRTPDAFAALAGVAPIPASSGQVQRMRLNRGGNRQLNRALHVIAVTQSRFHSPAKAYVTRRIEADGKTWWEAIGLSSASLSGRCSSFSSRAQRSAWSLLDR